MHAQRKQRSHAAHLARALPPPPPPPPPPPCPFSWPASPPASPPWCALPPAQAARRQAVLGRRGAQTPPPTMPHQEPPPLPSVQLPERWRWPRLGWGEAEVEAGRARPVKRAGWRFERWGALRAGRSRGLLAWPRFAVHPAAAAPPPGDTHPHIMRLLLYVCMLTCMHMCAR